MEVTHYYFSPSLPEDRYLNLGSKSDLRAEILGSIVLYDALAPRPEILFSFFAFYANDMFWVLVTFLRRRKYSKTNLFYSSKRIEKWQFSLLFQSVSCICCYCAFFVLLIKWFSSSLISSHKTKISVVLRMFMEDQPQNRQFLTISLTIA